jgi:hypothetical protein
MRLRGAHRFGGPSSPTSIAVRSAPRGDAGVRCCGGGRLDAAGIGSLDRRSSQAAGQVRWAAPAHEAPPDPLDPVPRDRRVGGRPPRAFTPLPAPMKARQGGRGVRVSSGGPPLSLVDVDPLIRELKPALGHRSLEELEQRLATEVALDHDRRDELVGDPDRVLQVLEDRRALAIAPSTSSSQRRLYRRTILNALRAGLESAFPALSVAWTLKVCLPRCSFL